MADVVEIFFNVVVQWYPVAVMDLPPTRDAWPNQVTLVLPGFVKMYEFRLLRPRPDYRHFTSDDVPELGKFVKSGSAQHTTHSRNDPTVLRDLERIGRRLYMHCPKLDHLEWLAILADALLSEEHRSLGINPNCSRNGQKQWTAND